MLLCLWLCGCQTGQVSADPPTEPRAATSPDQIRPSDFLYLRADQFTESQAAVPTDQALPSGVLHFGTFYSDDPTPCAFLDRPSAELGAAAKSWLVERDVVTLGYPVRLYGQGAPSWAVNEMYVHCKGGSQ